MDAQDDISQRKHARHYFRTKAQLAFSQQVILTVRTVDISKGGMCVISPNNLPPQAKCKIRFMLIIPPNTQKMCEIQTQVMQSIFSNAEDGFKVGLKFGEIDAETSALLDRFLQSGA